MSPTEKPARASGVSAAEKYAELETNGEERPRCECHGKEMTWSGSWRCRVSRSKAASEWCKNHRDKANKNQAVWRERHPHRHRRNKPVNDPNSTKYPDRIFWGGAWMTQEKIDRKKEHHADWCREKYATDSEYRERSHKRNQKFVSDPDFRRRRTLYQIDYRHRRKHERWADAGFTLGNDGEEGSQRRDRTAA